MSKVAHNQRAAQQIIGREAKQLLFKIYFGELGVARNRFRPTSTQPFAAFSNKTEILHCLTRLKT
jgi:hypothetical protein